MNRLLSIFILCNCFRLFSQEDNQKTFRIEKECDCTFEIPNEKNEKNGTVIGYVFDSDSLPIDCACVKIYLKDSIVAQGMSDEKKSLNILIELFCSLATKISLIFYKKQFILNFQNRLIGNALLP